MESIYAALLLHKAQKSITEASLKKVLEAAGATVDADQLKKVVAGIKSTNLDDLVRNASAMPMAVAAVPSTTAEKPKKPKKPDKEEKEEDEEPVGIGSLF